MQNLSIFHISTTTIDANSQHFILIHSKIFSIIGILLIPIVLICLTIFCYCYKRYLRNNLIYTDQNFIKNDLSDESKNSF